MPALPLSTVPSTSVFQARQHANMSRQLSCPSRNLKLQGLVSQAVPAEDTTFSDLRNLINSSLADIKTSVAPKKEVSPVAPENSQGAVSDKVADAAGKAVDAADETTANATNSAVDSFNKAADKLRENFFPSVSKQAGSPAAESPALSAPEKAVEADVGNAVSSATEKAGSAGGSVSDAAAQTSQRVLNTPESETVTSNLSNAASSAAKQTGAAASDAAAKNLPDVSASANSANDAASEARKALSTPVDSASPATPSPDAPSSAVDGSGPLEGITSTINDATASASRAFQDASAGLKEQADGLSTDVTKQFENVKQGVGKQLEGITDAAGDALQGAASQIVSAKEAASGIVSDLGSQVTDSASGVLEGLPTPLRDSVGAAAVPLSQALSNPRVSLTLVGAGVALPTLLWASRRFGGYAGLINPEKALQILETENSLLLDIRTEDNREVAGIPQLRFGARSKGAALPLVRISKRVGTQVVKANVLPYQLAAVLVQGFNKVDRGTKIIIMDTNEGKAIKLARAITSETGLRAFAMEGGFKGWVQTGLPVKQSVDYDASPLESVADTLQESLLARDPIYGIGAVSLGVTALAAVYDIHRTLQFVGAFAIVLNLATVPVRFNSIEEAKQGTLGPLLKVINIVGRFIPKSKKITGSQRPTTSGSSEQDAFADYESATPVSAELVETTQKPRADAQEPAKENGAKENGTNADSATNEPAKSRV